MNKKQKIKYNVWTIIEIADEKNDKYEDLKNEQIMLGSFKTLEDAKVFICEIERA